MSASPRRMARRARSDFQCPQRCYSLYPAGYVDGESRRKRAAFSGAITPSSAKRSCRSSSSLNMLKISMKVCEVSFLESLGVAAEIEYLQVRKRTAYPLKRYVQSATVRFISF